MRTFLIAGNWKMNKTAQETSAFFEQLHPLLKPITRSELLICPTFLALPEAFKANQGKIALGGQNVYTKPSGAYTGEISAEFLKEFATYAIVGHSERRTLLGESNAFINEKIKALLQAGLKPILCVGESLSERQEDRAFEVISQELQGCLSGISPEQMLQITIAYEPIWAIGTGETATPDTAEAMHRFIRSWIQENFNLNTASQVRILYGGSLNPKNAQQLLSQPDIDGGLIGGASLKPDSFIEIAQIAENIQKA